MNSAIVPLVELSSHHIAMRPYRDEDAPLLFVAASESLETVGRWMPWCHVEYAENDSLVWVRRCQASWHKGEEYNFGLFDSAMQSRKTRRVGSISRFFLSRAMIRNMAKTSFIDSK